MVDVSLLAITVIGPLSVAGILVFVGCPRAAIQAAATTAMYVGFASNEPFYSTLSIVLIALFGMGIALRFGMGFLTRG